MGSSLPIRMGHLMKPSTPRTRSICFVSLALLAIGILSTVLAPAQTPDAFEQNHKLGRGVNILGYDPIWRNRAEARFKERYFAALKEAGFNSVRINLHPFRHMEPDHTLRSAWWETLDWAVQSATAQGLMVILDLHEFNVMGEDPVATQPKFLAFWRQVSAHYRQAPSSVVFEILNEPCKKLTPELWNEYLAEALGIIRESNPTRTVIVGPAFWNNLDRLKELQLPAADRHLIVTVHYYQPMEFTHQGASWSNHKEKSGIEWHGSEAERQKIREDFAKAVNWAREQDRPIFVGEFGAYDRAPMPSRARYTDAIARTAESNGWSWAYWQFDSDFILYDVKEDQWVQPILRALVPR